jgi:hypothetical protein
MRAASLATVAYGKLHVFVLFHNICPDIISSTRAALPIPQWEARPVRARHSGRV